MERGLTKVENVLDGLSPSLGLWLDFKLDKPGDELDIAQLNLGYLSFIIGMPDKRDIWSIKKLRWFINQRTARELPRRYLTFAARLVVYDLVEQGLLVGLNGQDLSFLPSLSTKFSLKTGQEARGRALAYYDILYGISRLPSVVRPTD